MWTCPCRSSDRNIQRLPTAPEVKTQSLVCPMVPAWAARLLISSKGRAAPYAFWAWSQALSRLRAFAYAVPSVASTLSPLLRSDPRPSTSEYLPCLPVACTMGDVAFIYMTVFSICLSHQAQSWRWQHGVCLSLTIVPMPSGIVPGMG